MPKQTKLRRIIRYLLLLLGGVVAVLVLSTAILYFVAVYHHERVPTAMEQFSREAWGAEASFGDYRFQYFAHFPFLSLSLSNLRVRDTAYATHGRELLRIKQAELVFRPWSLIKGEVGFRSIIIDSARVQLYKSETGYFNAAFLSTGPARPPEEQPKWPEWQRIEKIAVRGLHFDYRDDSKLKHHRFVLQDMDLDFSRDGETEILNIYGPCFFHGLTFNDKNGPFLKDQQTELALHIGFQQGSSVIELRPSTLIAGQDTVHLSASVEMGQPGHLKVNIFSNGILLEQGRPLLADNLKETLKAYEIDRPLSVQVRLDGPIGSGQKQPLEVKISGDSLCLASSKLWFAQTQLEARYANNCDSLSPITRHTGCLKVALNNARLFDTIPLDLVYFNQDLTASEASITGAIDMPLIDLNGYLPTDQWQFSSGQLRLAFNFFGDESLLLDTLATVGQIELGGKGTIRDAELLYLPKSLALKDLSADFHFDERDLSLDQLTMQFEGAKCELSGKVYELLPFLQQQPNELRAVFSLAAEPLDLVSLFRPSKVEELLYIPRSGPALSQAINRLARQLPIELQVQAAGLRYKKLAVEKARFKAELKPNCPGGPCLTISGLRGEILDGLPLTAELALHRLQDPELQLRINMDLPLQSASHLVPDSLLRLHSGQVRIALAYDGRLEDYATLSQAALNAQLQGSLQLSDATFDYLPKDLRFEQTTAQLRFNEEDVFVDSLSLLLNGNAGEAEGRLHGLVPFLFAPGPQRLQASLNVESQAVDLSTFTWRQPARQPVSAKGAQNTGELLAAVLQSLDGQLSVRTDTLTYGQLQWEQVYFQSQFLNDCEGQGSCIRFDTLSAQLFGSIPMSAEVTVYQPMDPLLVAAVRVAMPVTELNRMFAPGEWRFEEGDAAVQFRYEGQPHQHFDLERALLKATITGSGRIENGAFAYLPKGYRFSELNSDFSFDGEDLHFEQLSLRLNENKLTADGSICHFLPFLFEPKTGLDAELQVQGSYFSFDRFQAPQKFQAADRGRAEVRTAITDLVEAGLRQIRASLSLELDTLVYRKFLGQQVKGKVEMSKGSMQFKDVGMELGGGRFVVQGEVTGLEENEPYLDLRASLQEVGLQQAFLAFDNFGQKSLRSQNLSGRLNVEADFRAYANANYELLLKSMEGSIELCVAEGALIDLPAFRDLRMPFFRWRDLSYIELAELGHTFDLSGPILEIGRLEVASSVLAFTLEGQYDFEGEFTDLLLEVPLGNLFQRRLLERAKDGLSKPNFLLKAKSETGEDLRFRWVLWR